MEGRTLSHYRILERLGGGGMGVVYKALDTNLRRHVAIKVLPQELTRDEEARGRFIHEAQAASALDHPNICTIHEIDATDDGQLFIVMAYYDGETLKKLIGRGRIPQERALDIARQMAAGLAKAHAAGIVHRDVKPANVMVGDEGLVKILDFGIAKLMGVTGPTIEGSTLGTVSYMSPEQVAGKDATPRSDLWSVGVVLYEMLTGDVPFPGQSPWAVMNSIANSEAPDPSELRPEIAPAVASIVVRLLRKDAEERFESAHALYSALSEAMTPASSLPPPRPRRTTAARVAAVLVVVVALGGGWLMARRFAEERRAREETLPQALALLEQDDYRGAFALAEELESVIPRDPMLDEVWSQAAVNGSIASDPEGAAVFVRPYGAGDDAWRYLGVTPIPDVRLVRSQPVDLRFEREGFETLRLASGVPGFYFGRGVRTATATLHEAGALPAEMVYVPGGDYPVRITGFNSAAPISIAPFLIDRYEVTNADFLEFVEAGGYATAEYWDGLEFVRDGEPLSWEEAMESFVDATGRPGPAEWEFGRYPEGRDNYPVSGVSWYEAVAYLSFRDKSLPTIFHWARAALEPHSNAQPLARSLIPAANFGGTGPLPVGASGAVTSNGAFDLAGNVREWTWNASGEHRWILGGAWDDEARMYSVRFTSPPFDRSSRHGFRGVRYLEGPPDASLMEPVDLLPRDYRGAVAVSDDIYEAYRRLLAYVPTPVEPAAPEIDATPADHVWEYVALDRSGSDEPFGLVILHPKEVPPPHPVLVYFPGIGPFQTRPAGPMRSLTRVPPSGHIDFIVRSGRAVVIPLWAGSYERWDEFLSLSGDQYLRSMGARMGDWATDIGVTLDYLETRDDLRSDRVGYYGVSFGASTSLALLALEPRLRGALLLLPGFTYRDLPPEADAVNHAPRITMPVLMIGGRYDYVFPVQTAQQPLYDQLGTPEEEKTFLLYEMGHGPFPRGQLIRDVLPFLDRYLPVGN